MAHIRPVGGSWKVSSPRKWTMMNPGHRKMTLKRPTKPKNKGMLALPSSPTRFFIKTLYRPYTMALSMASTSPSAISLVLLCGKDPRFSSLLPDRSTREMRTIPTNEANTPVSFRKLNVSTPIQVPIRSVQMPVLIYQRRRALRL